MNDLYTHRCGEEKSMRKQTVAWLTVLVTVTVGVFSVPAAEENRQDENSITVVYNHEGSTSADGLLKRGGFSAHVKFGDRSILFDTGGEASVILENLQRAQVDLAELDAVLISHNHWDHVYGLPGVMSGSRTEASVYVPASAAVGVQQQFPRATVVAVQAPKQIALGAWVTQPLDTNFLGEPLSEQALVLEHPDGLHIIAGCSHPGIVAIVERAKEMLPETQVALVAGGFHLRSTGEEELRKIASDLERLGVRKIGPTHCTGDAAKRIFRERWGERFVSFDLGDTYRF
jgi:7,8-dihydropterin-6-yl-methyl-4-(beta-D-ribofuranosyl)aminobenzene 5'-phosphate synthase